MHSLQISRENNTTTIRINGKYCENTCDFKGKMFQGFGGWLGFEVDGCKVSNKILQTEKGKCIRCSECMNLCLKEIETKKVGWVNG